jgi:hypothetical protein
MFAIRTAFLAAFLCGATLAAAESVDGSGKAATETRNVTGFHALGLSVPGKLEIVPGDAEKLVISADDNILPLIETTVDRGELRIRFREHAHLNVHTRTPIRMTLTAKAIDALAISGSGDIIANTVGAQSMQVSISGSGNVTLAGKAQDLRVDISGSGDVKAGKLEAQSARVSIAGSGDATVWARESLRVSVAGSGDVRYYGDPTVQRTVAGSGSVRRAGAAPG